MAPRRLPPRRAPRWARAGSGYPHDSQNVQDGVGDRVSYLGPMTSTATPPAVPARTLRPLPRFIFASRWLQLPLYLGLIVAQVVLFAVVTVVWVPLRNYPRRERLTVILMAAVVVVNMVLIALLPEAESVHNRPPAVTVMSPAVWLEQVVVTPFAEFFKRRAYSN